MSEANYAGNDHYGRRVYLTFCSDFEQVVGIEPPQAPFVLCIGGDSSGESVEVLFSCAENALEKGAVYVLCWGPGAARLEEIVDEAFVARSMPDELPTVMTTSHEGESLQEALAFAATYAQPVAAYANDCRTSVVVIVGNLQWYNEAQNCMEDLLTTSLPE